MSALLFSTSYRLKCHFVFLIHPIIKLYRQDVKVADIDDAEWEELAEAAGLSLSFTGDECQDAWEQLWHDDTAPGYEVRFNFSLNISV